MRFFKFVFYCIKTVHLIGGFSNFSHKCIQYSIHDAVKRCSQYREANDQVQLIIWQFFLLRGSASPVEFEIDELQ
jgi:hypothetical protein